MSYQQIRPGGFQVLPTIIKNLIIINALVFLAQVTSKSLGSYEWVTDYFALHNVHSSLFKPHQLVTHIFMHGDLGHLFFNMFALWMFGSMLENMWGPKRFLTFYILCGLGAAALHLLWLHFESRTLVEDTSLFLSAPSPDRLLSYFNKYGGAADEAQRRFINTLLSSWRFEPTDANFIDQAKSLVEERSQLFLSQPTVGASGAVFGCLAAFGYLFPNTLIYIYFLFPIKAKWFVMIYAAIELWMGINNSGGNIAHFAHLGGALIGFLLVLYWNKTNRRTFY
ncbi:MAG TPA: rhomboid family intramembrane serine protease [Lacibacter sp.]|nr:rhomboid family intramembrane serine protease [Lacibacter sp.]